MQSKKEALLAIYRGEMPEFIPAETKCTAGVVFPGDRYFGENETGDDWWGVNWTRLGPDPGLDGSMVSKGFMLFEDMEAWEEKVHFPDLDKLPVKQILQGMASGMDRENNVTHVLMLSGAFERMNEMVGMENALCAFYECPEAVADFFNAMCDYKLKCIQLAYDAVHPDIIHMHDDWGTNTNMFFSPELWREFIKPIEARYAKKIHEMGMIYEHHSCGYITQIIPDLVEIGVDCINPLNICNDMGMIKREYGQRITLKGGINNQKIDAPGCPESEIRAEARAAMDAYAPGGRYIPAYIYSSAAVRDIFNDEVEKYGAKIYSGTV